MKGLEILPRTLSSSGYVKLTDYGGKMAVLWEEKGDQNLVCRNRGWKTPEKERFRE